MVQYPIMCRTLTLQQAGITMLRLVLQGAMDETAAGNDALRRTAQATANAAAIAAAAPALDYFTLLRARWGGPP